jgi:hypothetical protein
MPDIKVDGGKNLWMDKGNKNYVLIFGDYFFKKHGETKQVAGGTIIGWKSIADVYKFFKDTPFQLTKGFQTIKSNNDQNKDTVVELNPSELKKLKPEDIGLQIPFRC